MADEAKARALVGSSQRRGGDEKEVQPSSKHRSLAGARAATMEAERGGTSWSGGRKTVGRLTVKERQLGAESEAAPNLRLRIRGG